VTQALSEFLVGYSFCNDRSGLIPFQPLGELMGPTQAKTTRLSQSDINHSILNQPCDR